MYLIDTNVVSESRKRSKADSGVRAFFKQVAKEDARVFISVVTVGELRRGVELIRHRGDRRQANQLEKWLDHLLQDYEDRVLDITADIAQLRDALLRGQADQSQSELLLPPVRVAAVRRQKRA